MDPNEKTKLPVDHFLILKSMVNNGLLDIASKYIRDNHLKMGIVNGQVVDLSDSTDAWLNKFITINPIMMRLKEDIRKLAPVDDSVLITGPTGTGKELLAHALHGERSGKFQAVNCAGMPEQLIESELFGHVKGAFTGATSDKEGLMRTATSGTLFLDEVGELPIQVQGKLLRALQSHEIRPVGSTKHEKIDCRVVCATNRDIEAMCESKEFRLDLYARLAVIELQTTPLIERQEDIIPIIESLPDGDKFLQAVSKNSVAKLNLKLNVRSLQRAIRRYVLLGSLPVEIINESIKLSNMAKTL